MKTKVLAAKTATASGCAMVIMHGAENHPLRRLKEGAANTLFTPQLDPYAARKGWIAACHARRVEADARARARDWLSGAAPAARELRAAVLRAADGVVFTPVGGNGGGNARDEL
jgi:glutamate 5-kinase